MRALVSLFVALSLAAAAPAFAGNGKGKNKNHGASGQAESGVTVGDVVAAAIITSQERTIILDYFEAPPAAFVGAKPLPPGIAKKLARGGTLPPGIAKRYFPRDLIVQLPPRPGYEWRVVGTDVVLLAVATGIVVDILIDVF